MTKTIIRTIYNLLILVLIIHRYCCGINDMYVWTKDSELVKFEYKIIEMMINVMRDICMFSLFQISTMILIYNMYAFNKILNQSFKYLITSKPA